MARIRTFIAVDPGKIIRERLIGLQGELAEVGGDVKWVEPQNLHFTLLFLGEVKDRELLDVCKVVKDVAAKTPAFSLRVEGTGCFPNMRRPRILWVGVTEGSQEMTALHDALEQPLLDMRCYRREERTYTPHITLGRTRTDDPVDELAAVMTKKQNWKAGEARIQEVHVMSSDLTRQGPQYTVLARAKLQ